MGVGNARSGVRSHQMVGDGRDEAVLKEEGRAT